MPGGHQPSEPRRTAATRRDQLRSADEKTTPVAVCPDRSDGTDCPALSFKAALHMSVTSSVTLPPGLPATNPIDVEIQFGTAGMVHDTYNPTLGTQIAFDFPVNDGGSRSERLVVSLAERRPGGAVAMNFTTTVVIYPLFNIALSPLTFYLINDCDGIAGFPLDSEPFVSWADDRGADG